MLNDDIMGYMLSNAHKKSHLLDTNHDTVKADITQEEALAWHGSAECMKLVQEFEDIGRKKFGEDHWMKWGVSYFWTTAHE